MPVDEPFNEPYVQSLEKLNALFVEVSAMISELHGMYDTKKAGLFSTQIISQPKERFDLIDKIKDKANAIIKALDEVNDTMPDDVKNTLAESTKNIRSEESMVTINAAKATIQKAFNLLVEAIQPKAGDAALYTKRSFGEGTDCPLFDIERKFTAVSRIFLAFSVRLFTAVADDGPPKPPPGPQRVSFAALPPSHRHRLGPGHGN